jgi:hypothetical protein
MVAVAMAERKPVKKKKKKKKQVPGSRSSKWIEKKKLEN